MIEVSIIIVNYNLTKEVEALLDSINSCVNLKDCKIFVVDNCSADNSIKDLVPKFPIVEFIFLDTNYGFGNANNYVFKNYKANYYLLINPDSILVEDIVIKLKNFMTKHEDAGIVGPLMLNEDGSVQESARKFPGIFSELTKLFGLGEIGFKLTKKIRHLFSDKLFYQTDFVYGSCMMIKSRALDEIGFFDERFFLFSEEIDLCYRLKNNTSFKVFYFKEAKVIHLGGQVTNQNKINRIRINLESQLLFYKKNYSKIKLLTLKILNVLTISLRYITVPFFASKNRRKEYYNTYKYLLQLYIK